MVKRATFAEQKLPKHKSKKKQMIERANEKRTNDNRMK